MDKKVGRPRKYALLAGETTRQYEARRQREWQAERRLKLDKEDQTASAQYRPPEIRYDTILDPNLINIVESQTCVKDVYDVFVRQAILARLTQIKELEDQLARNKFETFTAMQYINQRLLNPNNNHRMLVENNYLLQDIWNYVYALGVKHPWYWQNIPFVVGDDPEEGRRTHGFEPKPESAT
jgi:hypothetical protein